MPRPAGETAPTPVINMLRSLWSDGVFFKSLPEVGCPGPRTNRRAAFAPPNPAESATISRGAPVGTSPCNK